MGGEKELKIAKFVDLLDWREQLDQIDIYAVFEQSPKLSRKAL